MIWPAKSGRPRQRHVPDNVFADEPSVVAGQMLLALVPDPLWWSVGDPHPDSGETSLELSFRGGAILSIQAEDIDPGKAFTVMRL
jgi:hypothetical protein